MGSPEDAEAVREGGRIEFVWRIRINCTTTVALWQIALTGGEVMKWIGMKLIEGRRDREKEEKEKSGIDTQDIVDGRTEIVMRIGTKSTDTIRGKEESTRVKQKLNGK